MSISDIFTWLPVRKTVDDKYGRPYQDYCNFDDECIQTANNNIPSGLSLSSYVLSDTSANNRDIMLTADNTVEVTVEVFLRGRGYSLSC